MGASESKVTAFHKCRICGKKMDRKEVEDSFYLFGFIKTSCETTYHENRGDGICETCGARLKAQEMERQRQKQADMARENEKQRKDEANRKENAKRIEVERAKLGEERERQRAEAEKQRRKEAEDRRRQMEEETRKRAREAEEKRRLERSRATAVTEMAEDWIDEKQRAAFEGQEKLRELKIKSPNSPEFQRLETILFPKKGINYFIF